MENNAYGLLKGKKGIIFGAMVESSLAWKIAQAVHREGGQFVLSNAPVTKRVGQLDQLAEETGGSPIIYADATSMDDLNALFAEAKTRFGGLDFVVHSIGMGLNVRKNRPYEDLNYAWFQKTLDISAISLHRTVKAALDQEALNAGSSVVALSYVGAQRIFSKYSEMGDAKALLESIVRSFGYRLGKHGIRINTISQSPTKTVAGQGIEDFDTLYDWSDLLAPLGNASSESCADFTVAMLSDLTRMVTMQNLFHDGGYSAMGFSDETLDLVAEAFEARRKAAE